MEKLKMQSENLVNDNIGKIAELFPNCVTEGYDNNGKLIKMVDFDLLKQELSDIVVEGNDERYTMTWPGKKQSILIANSPINATLRPCREESVDFDNTQNLYIEGDNLDVLKLLRETYLNKIKMIYIDPPYNTSHDFVYKDDFTTSAEEYLQASKSYDEQGNKLFQNNNSNGRFHSDWLSMMYSRLKLARDLLSDQGVIFISIDHNEILNLSKVGDEIFGNSNKLGILSVINNLKGRSDDNYFATCNEFLLVYAKNRGVFEIGGFKLNEEELESDYDKADEISSYKLIGFRKTGRGWERSERPYMFYPVLYKNNEFSTVPNEEMNKIYNSKSQIFDDSFVVQLTEKYQAMGYTVTWPKTEEGIWGRWRWGKETFQEQKDINLEYNKAGTLCTKMRATLEDGSIRLKTAKTVWYRPEYDTGTGAEVLKKLFDNSSDLFDNPKSTYLLDDIIKISTDKNAYILDFFSGSATTAHAVMQLNAEEGGNRKYICVQLPEKCDEKSEAFKAGYKNICEIGKERIRRAGKKIKEENPLLTNDLDTGFRVLKLDSSCMKDVYYNPDDMTQDLLAGLEDNIKEDRTPEDLLFQVMLDMGVLLSSKIEEKIINNKKVFIVGEYDNDSQPNLICCFDNNLTDDVVKEIAKMQPLYAVFRDSSIATDSVNVNFDQIFETYSPTTTRRVL